MGSKKSDILYLFHRPLEPVYMPKSGKKVAFAVPTKSLPESRQEIALPLLEHFGADTVRKIPVKEVSPPPDLSVPLQLGRREPFSIFIPKHQRLAARLIDIFLGTLTYDDLLSVSVYCRDRVNPQMFVYALSVAILNHPDTKNLSIPSLSRIFPEKFIDSGILASVREEANIVPPGCEVPPIEIQRDYSTASDLDVEHRVAYWREDIGINNHHWHWHLVYPSYDINIKIVNKDRRGELFYYMHHQILARYNCERLCNQLKRVKRFHNLRESIPEGYFSKLDSSVTSRTWPARPVGAVLKDINRPKDQLNFDLQDLERWRDRIYEAVHSGAYINLHGERMLLTECDGIDVLGNIVEASILSPNQNVYGNLHNHGHNAISLCHDPDNRHLETFSIMGEPATAMRDPIFYRFHAFIDDIFLEHKNVLRKYETEQLNFRDVEITNIEVQTPNQENNLISTFWDKSDVDLSCGLDFVRRNTIFVRFTHLNHIDFTYRIVAHNYSKEKQRGTVRIFIAPREDESGLPFLFSDQKDFMIEMDKFTVLLELGSNIIERKSTESSVIIPFESTFPDHKKGTLCDDDNLSNFCGCGWPQHMLVPKGNENGFPMDLFVMISDYTGDAVEQDESTGCKDAVSYCGLRDRKYPDKRPMGYPFDRKWKILDMEPLEKIHLTEMKNMKVIQIKVRHTKVKDKVEPEVRSGSVGNLNVA